MMNKNNSAEQYFRRFLRQQPDKYKQAKGAEAVSTILSSFGNDVYNCKENFNKQDILYEDLGSLSVSDLEKLGIKEIGKRNEILQEFSELPNQDYTLRDIINLSECQDFNNNIFDQCSTFSEHMRLALLAANLKLKFAPSGDVVIDERHYASKFVVDAVTELMKITEQIEKRLEVIELIVSEQESNSKHIFLWKSIGVATLIGLGITWIVKH